MIPRILVIAGSDSGGGAGIQADIKTITMLGGHAMTAITAITAQNTLGVRAVQVLAPELVLAQIDAVVEDIGVDAVKIGMLGSAAIAHAVADRLATLDAPIVFDPVMVASSGAALANAATVDAFERLMRAATLVTPNLPELAVLQPGGHADDLARRIGRAVLAKGGHGDGETLVDRLVTPHGGMTWRGARIASRHTHGTGCTLASAIAVGLSRGEALEDAITAARAFVRAAILAAPGLGGGHGPMGHGLAKHAPGSVDESGAPA